MNPYGLAFARPSPAARAAAQGDRQCPGPGTSPTATGAPVTGYQYSLDGGGWHEHRQQRRFSNGVGFSETHTLRVRAISAGQPGRHRQRHVPQRRGAAAAGPDVADPGGQHTAPASRAGPDTLQSERRRQCGAGWVERSEGRLTINCYQGHLRQRQPRWYRVTEGSHPGWFVKSTTVDLTDPGPAAADAGTRPTPDQRGTLPAAPCKLHPEQKRTTPMTMTTEQAEWFAGTFEKLVANVGQAVLGKAHVIRLTFTAMLAEGHVLFEDAPGTGKTSLARALAATVQGSNNRIQFTPDLLPSDVTGVTIYDQKTQKFEFHKGPIFNNIVLADEINRASPKTQSALLEVMEESRVTVDGTTYEAGRPFMVMATQNPIEQAGTYRLPEAQLDRFLIKTSIGYPDHASTVQLLGGANLKDRSKDITAVITTQAVADMADLAATTHVDTAVLEYISRLCEETRSAPETRLGVSVRGALAMVRAAKVWAASQGRNFVLPDDVKDLAAVVWTHRLVMDPEAEFSGATAEAVLTRVLAEV